MSESIVIIVENSDGEIIVFSDNVENVVYVASGDEEHSLAKLRDLQLQLQSDIVKSVISFLEESGEY